MLKETKEESFQVVRLFTEDHEIAVYITGLPKFGLTVSQVIHLISALEKSIS